MAPREEQRHFINSIDSFGTLWQACIELMERLSGGQSGLAAHSPGAVTSEELQQIIHLAKDKPVHIHIAERTGEVDECLAWSGARPVAWLMDHAPVDEDWTPLT